MGNLAPAGDLQLCQPDYGQAPKVHPGGIDPPDARSRPYGPQGAHGQKGYRGQGQVAAAQTAEGAAGPMAGPGWEGG